MKDHERNRISYGDQVRALQLPPLSPESVREYAASTDQMSSQPTMNIGMIGHVAHGKSSFVKVVSGVATEKHSKELIRNSTMQLGYANFKLYKCENMLCTPPECYQSHPSSVNKPLCKQCKDEMVLLRHISFVDCPGHEMLMRTMLNGAAVMDAAVLVVAANERVPQPQTTEHLAAAEIMNLHNILVIQNKVDLISPEQARESKKRIEGMLEGSCAQGSPVIPVSCAPNIRANIDVLLQYIVTKIPIPVRNLEAPARMKIIRSFDVNKPGTHLADLKGGVCGGSIECGILRVGEIVEIRPGLIQNIDGKKCYTPIVTRVTALQSETKHLQVALPGGLIGVGTKLDPQLTRKNRLVGQVLGRLDTLPDVYIALRLTYKLMRRVVGDESCEKVKTLIVGEEVMLTIGSSSVQAHVVQVVSKKGRQPGTIHVTLAQPICAAQGEKVSLSKKVKTRFRLIGCCDIVDGKKATLKE